MHFPGLGGHPWSEVVALAARLHWHFSSNPGKLMSNRWKTHASRICTPRRAVQTWGLRRVLNLRTSATEQSYPSHLHSHGPVLALALRCGEKPRIPAHGQSVAQNAAGEEILGNQQQECGKVPPGKTVWLCSMARDLSRYHLDTYADNSDNSKEKETSSRRTKIKSEKYACKKCHGGMIYKKNTIYQQSS